MLLNREKLAELVGCSLRTVDEYRRQGMPGEAPQKPGGQWRFESAAVIDWLRVRERQSALGEIAGISESDAKRRKVAAEAALAEHELAERQGSAVSIEDWQKATSQMVGSARAKLSGIGAAIGRDVALESDVAICEEIVQGAINEALLELSEGDIQIESSGDSESESCDSSDVADMGSAPGPDRERVVGRRKTPQPRKQR